MNNLHPTQIAAQDFNLHRQLEAAHSNYVQACLSRDNYRRECYELASYMDDVLSALLNNDPEEAKKLAESAMAKWGARHG